MKNDDTGCHAPDDLTCRQFILEHLLAYEDGSMPEPEREELRRHIEMCPPCVEFLSTYEATGLTLKLLKPKDIPSDLARTVISFVRSRSKEKE